jgi:hypothetical protein
MCDFANKALLDVMCSVVTTPQLAKDAHTDSLFFSPLLSSFKKIFLFSGIFMCTFFW